MRYLFLLLILAMIVGCSPSDAGMVIGSGAEAPPSGITFVAAESGTTNGDTSVVANKPTGTVNNDVMIGCVYTNGNAEDHSDPGDWATILEDLTNGSDTMSCWYKVASGEGASYTFTGGSTEAMVLIISTFRGVDTADVINVFEDGLTTTSTSVTSQTITTDEDGCMIIAAAEMNDDEDAMTVIQGGYTSVFGATLEIATTVGADTGIRGTMSYELQESLGATGDAVGTQNESETIITQHFALNPA